MFFISLKNNFYIFTNQQQAFNTYLNNQFIFSDKTGTLTKNYMEFQEMSIGSKKYGKPDRT